MLLMLMMEWANAVSARRGGEVTGAKLDWASATRSLLTTPIIDNEISKRKLE